MSEFRLALLNDLRHAINCNSAENGSDTPDFILASYLLECLQTFDRATSAREKWYGREARTDASSDVGTPTQLKGSET